MSDDIVTRLRAGAVLHLRRWSGDTHTDLGGSINEGATDAVMAEAADEIGRLRAWKAEATEVIERWDAIAHSISKGHNLLGIYNSDVVQIEIDSLRRNYETQRGFRKIYEEIAEERAQEIDRLRSLIIEWCDARMMRFDDIPNAELRLREAVRR